MNDKTNMQGPSSPTQEDDPATRLLRRGGLVFLVGGFLVFMVPKAVVGLVSGDTERAIGSAIALAFWAWLTWRSVLLLRLGDRAQDPRYWFVSAAGYAAFLVLDVIWVVWHSVTDGFEARSGPFIVILFGLTLVTWLAGRKAAERVTTDQTV